MSLLPPQSDFLHTPPHKSAPSRKNRLRRPGSTLVEVTASLALVGMALVAAAQLHALTARQLQSAAQQRIMTREAQNVMEQLLALSYDELTAQGVRNLALSPETQRRLPNATLSVHVESAGLDPPAKRFRVEIDRPSAAQGFKPVVFWGWKYELGTEVTP